MIEELKINQGEEYSNHLDGKVIGQIIEGVYVSHRKPNHFFRIYQGFGISEKVLEVLVRKNIQFIKIIYHGAEELVYLIPVEDYVKSDKVYSYSAEDKQKFVRAKDYEIKSQEGTKMKIKWTTQVHKSERLGAKLPMNCVSLCKSYITLSQDLAEKFADFSHCVIYLAPNRIGFEATNDKSRGFAIRQKKYLVVDDTKTKAKTGRYFAYYDAEEEKIIVDLDKPLLK